MAEYSEVINTKKRMCKKYQRCYGCALESPKKQHNMTCIEFLEECPQEAEEIIMKWAEEHPIIRNKDKARELFGVEMAGCIGIKCQVGGNEFVQCRNCDFRDFWEKEYKEPKGE